MSKRKVLILSRGQSHHFEHLYNEHSLDVIETTVWTPETVADISPDILLTPSCDWYESYNCIQKAKSWGIPTLYCPDGIIEWKHTWENPRYGVGGHVAYQQPVATDKIACIGLHSMMLLQSFGNINKVELVGAPRFDMLTAAYSNIEYRKTIRKTILIATANTPAFTEEQMEFIKTSLLDLKIHFENNPQIKPIWRVNAKLKSALNLIDEFPELTQKKLIDVLPFCDAVICSQSTLMLEAWLYKLPLATINYGNFPEYINPAFRITHKSQLPDVIHQLLNPDSAKLHFQETQLQLNLHMTNAAQRQIDLIHKMIDWKEQFGNTHYPNNLLSIELNNTPIIFNHQQLYPEHPDYNTSKDDLYQQLIFLKEENRHIRIELQSRNIHYWFSKFFQSIYKKWK